MAFDKVVDSAWLDEGLTKISNAIRIKTGDEETLSFPDGIINAVSGIDAEDNTAIDSLIDRSIASIVNTTATSVGLNTFRNCTKLVSADFSKVTTIYGQAFGSCSSLESLILRNEELCTLKDANALNGTKISGGSGYIYVPAELLESYKAATNWASYADRIIAIGGSI